jgi:hypothetical protein
VEREPRRVAQRSFLPPPESAMQIPVRIRAFQSLHNSMIISAAVPNFVAQIFASAERARLLKILAFMKYFHCELFVVDICAGTAYNK